MEHGIRVVILLWVFLTGSYISNAQEVSTVGEIYNFEVGDTFHFTISGSSPYSGGSAIRNIIIIDKSYSLNNDTVFYERDIAYQETYPLQYTYYFIDTVSYANLDSLINMGNIDTVYSDPDRYNGRLINDITHYYYWGHKHYEYVNGCGVAYFYYDDHISSVTSEEELVYFKKGTEEWGTPIIVGIEDISSKAPFIAVFPNPFTTSTTIEYELKEISNIQFTIYNVIGEVVYNAEDHIMPQGIHTVTWSPSHLPEGLYYAVLRSEEGVSVVKMVKQ